ncbi:MAG: hypothetical protein ACSHX8_09935 [Opitutaceae bacterium]
MKLLPNTLILLTLIAYFSSVPVTHAGESAWKELKRKDTGQTLGEFYEDYKEAIFNGSDERFLSMTIFSDENKEKAKALAAKGFIAGMKDDLKYITHESYETPTKIITKRNNRKYELAKPALGQIIMHFQNDTDPEVRWNIYYTISPDTHYWKAISLTKRIKE